MRRPHPQANYRFPVVDPELFRKDVRKEKLEVFLCGPGYDSRFFNIRESIKTYLERHNVNVHFGEETEYIKSIIPSKNIDLQTMEVLFANKVDFTILLLNSPGSMAELGTFTLIESIRLRLFVVVSDEFHKDDSYIARGPLTILSRYSQLNVIYLNLFQSASDPLFLYQMTKLNFCISFFKYINFDDWWDYRMLCLSDDVSRDAAARKKAVKYIADKKKEFLEKLVLNAIVILGEPTFADLLLWLRLSPDELRNALRNLFTAEGILKNKQQQYTSVKGFADVRLEYFDSGHLSKRRAEILSCNY